MDTKKRRLEINIWNRPDFEYYTQVEIPFYWLVKCKCDNAGVYLHNKRLAEFHCRGEIDFESFVEKMQKHGEPVEVIGKKKIWLKDFIRETWGTLSWNNFGKSCYKLLVKHDLLEKFISEYPDCIKLDVFIEKINEGEFEAPLPQARPKPDPENKVSKELEGVARPRPATNNNNTTNNDNNSSYNNNNINPEPSLTPYFEVAEELKKIIPKRLLNGESDISFESDIKSTIESIEVDNPKQVIIDRAKEIDWEMVTVPEFFETLKNDKSEAAF